MSKHNIVFIGMDTHKSFIEVAYIEDVRGIKKIHLGKNTPTKQSVKKLVRRLESTYPHATLHFVYVLSLWNLAINSG
ncbi:hypothetical protein [Moritella sp. JT01]|uniref:hypothetical protein n=1 Tax=Moritella sp. JT01 TaxID=756698 RepID=UPI00082C5DDE